MATELEDSLARLCDRQRLKIEELAKAKAELLAALIELRDGVKDDSPDMWGRVEDAIIRAGGGI